MRGSSGFGGDTAYGGRITKNPLVQPHVTLWGDQLYELRTLSEALADLGALPGTRNPRKTLTASSVGRNVALFDLTRTWAYKAIRTHWDGPQGVWETDVFAHAWQHNETVIANDFTRGPLAYTEVHHLAQSIARWTWRNMTRDTFSARQSHVGKRGGKRSAETRHAKAKAVWEGLS